MLRYLTAGESHGKAMIVILDGVPAGMTLDISFINEELKRRMFGYGRGGRMKIESDTVEILGGIRKNMTIGSPVSMAIFNKDYKIETLPDVLSPRPGHADLAGMMKFGFKEARGVLERASARETVARVAAGAVAKLILMEFGISVFSHIVSLGSVKANVGDLTLSEIAKLSDYKESKLRCADKNAEKLMCAEIDMAREKGDTLGGSFEIVAIGVPPGLGSYTQWDKRLDGILAKAILSIQAVKGFSVGRGIESSMLEGSRVHDPISFDKKKNKFDRLTNNAGGLEGGITNGEPVVVHGFMKPISTLMKPLSSVDMKTKMKSGAATERSDVTAVPACGIIAEAVVAIEIASSFLEKFGGDSIAEIRVNHKNYVGSLRSL